MSFFMEVGVVGFEPTATASQTRCATRLRYTPGGMSILAAVEGSQLAEWTILRSR